MRQAFMIRSLRRVLVALLVGILTTTLTLLALVFPAISRLQRKEVSRALLGFCADPGHCGGNMMVSVSREEVTATSFARTWASDWDR
jgi:hypothetical protein